MSNEAFSGFDPATIESRIRTFESFGVHRTGWPGDDETTRWLQSELRSAGIAAERERFPFTRLEEGVARLRWPDGEAAGVPLYDGGLTHIGGVDGQLVSLEEDEFGCIVVTSADELAESGSGGSAVYERLERLGRAGAVGLVLVSADEDGDVVLRNAERIDRPLAIPVLQVGSRDAAMLASAVVVGAEATLEVSGERLKSTATNVVATLPGTDPEAAPVGVMTPKSGWFTCAAERGGGIAIWLALAEALAAMPERRRPVELVASSGHELHHGGLAAYLKSRPRLAGGATAWLHLGASIGARRPRPRMGASDDELLDIAARALDAADAGAREAFPVGSPGFGEARDIAEAGGRYVSFLGGHPLFHSPNDSFDRAVDADSVARHARAALSIVEAMLLL